MARRVHGSTVERSAAAVALMSAPALATRVLAGNVRAVARAITLIDDDAADAPALVAALYEHGGRARIIGVTGPPGAGKSTLVDRLARALRAGTPTRTIGVLAVDPSSPFSGGAVLGDRLRMQAHAADPDVFIRSMATRGHLGGLSRATADAALVLDAAGKDIVIIETVGVGQDEVEIVRTADISIVVLVPGTGDDVQALKAGLMEIADVFVVNKADRDGADHLVSAIEATLTLRTYREGEWRPPVLATTATTGAGVPELLDAIERFHAHAARERADGEPGSTLASRRRVRSEARLREVAAVRLMAALDRMLDPGEFDALVDRLSRHELDPYTAAEMLVARLAGGSRH